MKKRIDNIKSHRTGVSTFASHASPSTVQSLQKSFHLSNADKIEFKKISSPSKNKKYATAQTNTTKTMTVKRNNDNGLQGRTTRTTGYNSGFAKKRVQWLIEHSTSHQLLWYVDSFELRNPLLRKAAKRCTSP
ncbi:hypothetical protein [Sediminibacterium sp.]|jgi:hypothetical protein|uniref:hypothetical protein n=1 Tax=Sediminibacterium sp. TaxID=1917865 RepID=UPI003F6E4822